MLLRKLKLKDAIFMLEWMHDEDITQHLATDFAKFSLGDCENFILRSITNTNDLHMAIVSYDDEYMGTVSLKNIDYESLFAEFAITIRKTAMGKGYAIFAMNEIFKIALQIYKLGNLYWCVSANNDRACRFYDKYNFERITNVPNKISSKYNDTINLRWYKKDLNTYRGKDQFFLSGVKLIDVQTINLETQGKLSFFEANRDIPFEIKRVYYITNIPQFMKRGFHAHKELKQFIFCPYGEVKLSLDDGFLKQEFSLSSPSVGLMIDKPIWREIDWIIDNSVLVVAASDYYYESDYLRDYNEFLSFINSSNNNRTKEEK